MTPERHWSLEEEIKLFSLVCDHKPAGEDKEKHMAQIMSSINEERASKFSEAEIWAKLGKHYNLVKVDELEVESEHEEAEGERPKSEKPERQKSEKPERQKSEKPEKPKTEKPDKTDRRSRSKEDKLEKVDKSEKEDNDENEDEKDDENDDENDDAGLYSSELSDVEGEDPEVDDILRMKTKEKAPRGPRKSTRNEETKKRTRLTAKLDVDVGGPAKKRRASTPPHTKRRTRSEIVADDVAGNSPPPEEETVKEKEADPEEPKRRSTRAAVRRSSRKK